MLVEETGKTLFMTIATTFFAYLIGLPLGVILYVTSSDGLRPMPRLNAALGWIVNVGRSIPFILLMIAMIPLTRLMVGSASGTIGALPPLIVGTFPFVARIVEQSIREVGGGVVEAAQSCGASHLDIVRRVIIPESLPSIVRGLSITLILVFGYSAIAGVIGAGGLGDVGIRFGYYRYQNDVMIATIVIMIVLVQIFQSIGDAVARAIDKR